MTINNIRQHVKDAQIITSHDCHIPNYDKIGSQCVGLYYRVAVQLVHNVSDTIWRPKLIELTKYPEKA